MFRKRMYVSGRESRTSLVSLITRTFEITTGNPIEDTVLDRRRRTAYLDVELLAGEEVVEADHLATAPHDEGSVGKIREDQEETAAKKFIRQKIPSLEHN